MSSNEITNLKNSFFASCPTGLEELLAAEIKALEYEKLSVVKGGVHFLGQPKMALELMLSSRIASRIYKKAYEFNIRTEKDLYYRAKEIMWKEIFELGQTFKISVVQGKSLDGSKRSQFKSSIFLAQNLKDGIVDRFRDDCEGERPSVEKDQPDMNILLRVEPVDDENSDIEIAHVLFDMCGQPLSHRGYRTGTFTAPLKENLAAGLVLLSGYTGEETFIDPMCGSGTIIIESLLIKGDIPPSYLALHEMLNNEDEHYFDFQKHLWFAQDENHPTEWKALLDLYLEKARDGFEKLEKSTVKTIASDRQRFALQCFDENIKAADLLEFVEINEDDATTIEAPSEAGILICNPPYGERIGSNDQLPALYYDFGENLKKNFKNYKAYVFTGNLALIKKISLRTTKKHILFNGSIDSRLAEYLLY